MIFAIIQRLDMQGKLYLCSYTLETVTYEN